MPTVEVPGPADKNNERLASRPYESDFARFPEEEVAHYDKPGAGPHGGLDDGPVLPKIVTGLGLLVTLATFLLGPVALVLGLVLVLAGAAWTALSEPKVGMGQGTGTVQIDEGHEA